MWLRLKQGDKVNACISCSSVKSIVKHGTGSRSELCIGEGCPHCLKGIPRRWRYQATLLIGSDSVEWEFGEQSMTDLNDQRGRVAALPSSASAASRSPLRSLTILADCLSQPFLCNLYGTPCDAPKSCIIAVA